MKPTQTIHVLLISESTRTGSSSSLALRRMHGLDHPGVSTDLYPELTDLPAFVPADDPPPLSVVDPLTRIEKADAAVFSTPEYSSGLPGALKNPLDWTVGGGQLYRKPVAWPDVAKPGRGQDARAQLQSVLGYVGAHIVEPACLHLALDTTGSQRDIPAAEETQLRAAHATLPTAVQEEHHAHAP
jgi:NAD(P)H-dependent FMN reductase